jgi:hypothetical protein
MKGCGQIPGTREPGDFLPENKSVVADPFTFRKKHPLSRHTPMVSCGKLQNQAFLEVTARFLEGLKAQRLSRKSHMGWRLICNAGQCSLQA